MNYFNDEKNNKHRYVNIIISKNLNHKINYNISKNILAKILKQPVHSTGLKASYFLIIGIYYSIVNMIRNYHHNVSNMFLKFHIYNSKDPFLFIILIKMIIYVGWS